MAARQFVACTGYPAAIIEENDFPRFARLARSLNSRRIRRRELPYFAKLFLFDLLEAEDLIYFDADLLFVRAWNPADVIVPGKLGAVRDLWWTYGVLHDCDRGIMLAADYVNTGLLTLNRRDHWEVLREAARRFGSFPALLHEQSFLNFVLQKYRVPLEFLPRDYNSIDPWNNDEVAQFPPFGIHVKGEYPFPSYRQVVTRFEGRDTPSLTVKESGLAGVWRYERIGLDARILEFRPDGTIGQGSADCEQYWRVWRQDGDLVLGLFGVPLDDIRVTKTLEARRDGDGSWRGRWLRAEQCPIVLRPQL
jgi:hypothetical protein